jgi:hypothetical protein
MTNPTKTSRWFTAQQKGEAVAVAVAVELCLKELLQK